MSVSTDTIARQFGHLEGVTDLGAPEARNKRGKGIPPIPRHTLDRFIRERQVQVRRAR